jgi:hypothetical protein
MIVTTQQTAKKWKAVQALGCLTSLVAIGLFIAAMMMIEPSRREENVGMIAYAMTGLFLGSCCYATGRVGAWWHHG